jgi:hypothetical protein
MDDITKKLSDTHTVELPGAVLLALMERMMDEIVRTGKVSQAMTAKGLDEESKSDLALSLNASYVIGVLLFKEARRVFGDQFIDDFCSGKDVVPEPPNVFAGSTSIN